jgi:putative CocE/NonD family hydrolase
MNVAGIHIAGWNDLFLEGSLRNYIGMRTGSATQDSRDNQFLLIGPWSHGNLGDWQGDEWLGPEAAAGALDLTTVHLDFFTAILEGRRPDMPRVRYFTSGINRWQSAGDWPVASHELPLYLASSGHAATDSADGALTPKRPDHAGADTWTADPNNPVPTVGGPTFMPGMLYGRNSGPMSQSTVEARDDVAVYTTEPLVADLEVTGAVRLVLHAASDGTDCDWTARLVDVGADGTTRSVVDSILRARYRHGFAHPQPLTPGLVEAYEFALGSTSHVFLAGHRVRLQLASSNFPRFDRNPQQYIPIAQAPAKDFRTATQTVVYGPESPSRLLLPVVDDKVQQVQPQPV